VTKKKKPPFTRAAASKGGRVSARKLTKQERSDRARHAALVKHGLSESERQRDERKAALTVEQVRASMKQEARRLIEANENASVGSLTEQLQRRFRFYLTLRSARALIQSQLAWRDRNVATEAHAVPMEQPPACDRCGSANVKRVFVGPLERDAEHYHNMGDVIGPEEVREFWCESCGLNFGPILIPASQPRRRRTP
jgi:hypothetical protein